MGARHAIGSLLLSGSALIAACGGGGGGGGSAPSPSPSPTPTPTPTPTITFANVSVHDPSIIKVGTEYYVFGSHLGAAKSTDLMNWTLVADGVTNAIYVMDYMGYSKWGEQSWFSQLYPGDDVVDWIAYDPYSTGNGTFASMVDAKDDPYAPYFPGDEAVDWVGMSLYHWGLAYPWGENELPRPGTFEKLIRGEDTGAHEGGATIPDLYAAYADGHDKPMAIIETAILYDPSAASGPSEKDLKSAWFVTVFPGVIIVITALAANIFSNWLRAVEDPTQSTLFFRNLHKKRKPK